MTKGTWLHLLHPIRHPQPASQPTNQPVSLPFSRSYLLTHSLAYCSERGSSMPLNVYLSSNKQRQQQSTKQSERERAAINSLKPRRAAKIHPPSSAAWREMDGAAGCFALLCLLVGWLVGCWRATRFCNEDAAAEHGELAS